VSDVDVSYPRKEAAPAFSNQGQTSNSSQPSQPGAQLANNKTSKKRTINKKMLVMLVLLGVLIAASTGGAFAYKKYSTLKKENAKLSNPQEAAKVETDRLVADVAKIIELPNESPTIATVVDASKLKTQAFFASSQNGDKVLLYPQAKKAVLYRPSTKKVVEVAPINIGDSTQPASNSTTTPSSTPTTTPTKKP